MRSFAAFILVGLALQASICSANLVDRKAAPHRLLLLSGSVELPHHRGVSGGWTEAELALSSTQDTPTQHYYIHFDSESTEPHKVASGIDSILSKRSKEARARYLPHNTFFVSATAAELKAIQELPNVIWTGRMLPHHKFHQAVYTEDSDALTSPVRSVAERVARVFGPAPALRSTAALPLSSCTYDDMHRAKSGWKRVRVALGDFASVAASHELLKSWQATHAAHSASLLLCHTTHRLVSFWLIKQSEVPTVVSFFAAHPAVRWVEPVRSGEFHNAVAQWITQTGQPENRRYTDAGIIGHNQLVAVADTGLDWTHCFFYDAAFDIPAHQCKQCNYTDFTSSNTSFVCPFSTPECSKVTSHRKIAAYWAMADGSDESYGHGTHVCGTVAGAVSGGNAVMNKYNGTGQGARLVFTDMSSPRYHFAVPPHPSSQLFPFAYNMGARIFTNSWGSSSYYNPYYNYDSQDVDLFLRAHDDALMLFSAGNDGMHGASSISYQSQSKNAVIVGAGGTDQSHMPDIIAADAVEMWNQINAQACNPSIYLIPNGPCQMLQTAGSTIPCDHMYQYYCPKVQSFSYCCSMRHGNANDTALAALLSHLDIDCCESSLATLDANPDAYITRVAFFSSRGPTYDYRIKPDIISPGYSVISSRASDPANAAFHCSSDSDSSGYSLAQMAGTSMASPAAAGAVAVLREYLTKSWSDLPPIQSLPLNNPSGALMKAFIIHSAVPIYDQYRENVTVDQMYHPVAPWLTRNLSANNANDTYIMGFGRVQLSNVMRLPGDLFHVGFIDGSCEFLPLLTGQTFNLTINLSPAKFDPKRLLKVTLVWTDPAAEPFSAQALVNDLDLIVTSPTGQVVYGNTQYNLYQGGKDSLNNVEQVWFQAPQSGVYTVTVRGTHVPLPPDPAGQDYAIVYSYGLPAVYVWQPTAWSTCSAVSGIGYQTRNITCVASDGSPAPISSCHDSPPATYQPCCIICPDPTKLSAVTCSSSYIGSSQHVESVCRLNASLAAGVSLSMLDITRFHAVVISDTAGAAVSVNVDGPALSADQNWVTWTLHRDENPKAIPNNGWVQILAHYNLQNGQVLPAPGSAQVLSAVAPDGANITCTDDAIDPGFALSCILQPTYQNAAVYSVPSDFSLQVSDAAVTTSALSVFGLASGLTFQIDVSEHAYGRIFVVPFDGTGNPFPNLPTPFGFLVHLHPTTIGPVQCSPSFVGGYSTQVSTCSVNLTFAAGTVASLELSNLHLNLADLTSNAASGVAISSGPTIGSAVTNTVGWTLRQSGTAAFGFAQASVVFTPEAGTPVVSSAAYNVLSADAPDGAQVSCGPATFTAGSSTLCFVVPYKGANTTFAAPSDLAVKSSNPKVTTSALEFDSISKTTTSALEFDAAADASFSGVVTLTPIKASNAPLPGTVQTATVTVNSPPDSSDDSKKKGIIAGAVIGSLAVVAAIIVFSVWAYMNKRYCFEERPRAQSYFTAAEPEYDTEYRQL